MLVSVVVPVYNTERYLDRCISGLTDQTHRELEILLIDDGSTDRCPEICHRWCQKDHRIRVIRKENEGLGMARNTGIHHATGEYFCFVDSDDYLLPEAIAAALETAQTEAAEITFFGFILENEQGRQKPIVPNPSRRKYVGEEVQQIFLPEYLGEDPRTGKHSGIPGSACACLISMELIRRTGWQFRSEREILCEDVFSMLELCQDVKKIAVMEAALYCYHKHGASLTHTYLPDRFEKAKVYYGCSLVLCQQAGYSESVRRGCMAQFLGCTIAALKQEAARGREGCLKIHRILRDELTQATLAANRSDKVNLKKRCLFWAMRSRRDWLCTGLLRLQNFSDQHFL